MVMQDSYITIAWLGLLILLLIIEIITVGLTSIWAAGGALAALILNILGLSLVWQIVAFFVVTFVLLIFTSGEVYQYAAGEDQLRGNHRQDHPHRRKSR